MKWLVPLYGVIVALALATLASGALAEPAGAPRFAVGDSWSYSDGRQIKVVKVDDGAPVMTGALAVCPTCVVHYDRNLAIRKVTDPAGQPVEAAKIDFLALGPDWKFYAFPLDVKKTWKFSAEGLIRGKPQRYDVSVVVAALEDVQTKAGPFKAFKMERTWSGTQGAQPFSFTDVVWFAPRAKFPVKFQTSRAGVKPGELTAYSVK
ncbi:MAG TPA: hypothetical protein VJU81_22430 [Methylomirabilota bacterium]|nr:hypothetical protein [Methylomirabilota bacterium]